MLFLRRCWGGLFAVTMLLSCSEPPVHVEPGVSLELARSRAASVSRVRYRLHFDIPADPEAPIHSHALIDFDLAQAGTPLQLDFHEEGEKIRSVRSNGEVVDYRFVNEHILVPPGGLRKGRNSIEIDFLAGSGSLNRNPDYLYTLFVPDRARTAFPLFDQPDIKARYELILVLPPGWKALSTAPLAGVSSVDGRYEYRFEPSDLISSYLFSFVAGKFEVITRHSGERSMTMLHRETDEKKLARNLDAIFDLHLSSLSWLEEYTGIDYPFQKLDFVLIPSFQYGGMEHVGAIQYRASHLLLDEAHSDSELLKRAQLIAHETAHMWFGDLVTMQWFSDVWTKEVFANFMAGKIVNPGFPEINHDLNFLVNHHPPAYAVDRSEGPNPVRQALPNLNEAGQLYGAIIYHKAPIMMRQLELVVGPDRFRQGMREYLRRFSYANASWQDLISILDAGTDVDLAAWSEVWVNTPGRPLFQLQAPLAAHGETAVAWLHQVDAAGLGRVWPQRFSVLARAGGKQVVDTLFSTAQASPLLAVPNSPDPTRYLFNADGYGYGLFPVEADLFALWPTLGEVERGVLLIHACELLLEGRLTDVSAYFDRLVQIVQDESNQLLLDLALGQMRFIYDSLLPDVTRERKTLPVENALWDTLQAQQQSKLTRLFFKAFSAMACSTGAVERLRDVWSGKLTIDGLILEEGDRIALAEILAIRLPNEADAIIGRQIASTDNPDRRRRLEFLAPSLAADVAVRDAFFDSLRDVRNRHTETWVVDAVRRLHHPARLDASRKYILPSLELLQEIQVTGDIFFPSAWLVATLASQRSPEVAAIVRTFLEQRPDYNQQLRMKILQAADPLFRASRIRSAQPGATATATGCQFQG